MPYFGSILRKCCITATHAPTKPVIAPIAQS
ncbi:MAG: hypothetical protein ACI8TV_000375, partial [Porticoccaceae bacterium]